MVTITYDQSGERTDRREYDGKFLIRTHGGVFKSTAHPNDSIFINWEPVLEGVTSWNNLPGLQELEFLLEVRSLCQIAPEKFSVANFSTSYVDVK